MQENYFIMAELPICSYFDIDGARRCDVCKNSAYCYGDSLNIRFDCLETAEKWQELYSARSIFCRLLDDEAARRTGQAFLYYAAADDTVREYRFDKAQDSWYEAACVRAEKYTVLNKTARFAANVVKLIKQGK